MDEHRPNVVPIGGFVFPAPPDWRISDETAHLKKVQAGILEPEDLTLRGRPRCTHVRSENGIRCGNEAARGTTVCRFHGASNSPHPDDNRGFTRGEGPGTSGRQARIERVRTHLEYAAETAVLVVQQIAEDEEARTQDRLKAAEIILDRTVGKTMQLEREDAQERDLDQEILAIAETLDKTGTDGV